VTQFGEQFAKTSAVLDLLKKSAPTSFTETELRFATAMDSWDLANRIWNRKISTGRQNLWHTGEDLELLNETRRATGRAEFPPDDSAETSMDNMISMMLTIGSRDFERDRDAADSNH
jgi:hypothetical protein